MKVLEEFWYGNINPMERPFQSQRKFDKVFRLLTKNEEELLKHPFEPIQLRHYRGDLTNIRPVNAVKYYSMEK